MEGSERYLTLNFCYKEEVEILNNTEELRMLFHLIVPGYLFIEFVVPLHRFGI